MPGRLNTMLQRANRCALAAILASAPAASALGGCKDIYPDAQVITELTKPEYTACNLDRMETDYADILREQVRLLGLLRSAYQGQLQLNGFDENQQQVRLTEYDAKLQHLSQVAEALPAPPEGPGNAGEAAGADASRGDHDIHKLLKQSKEYSQTLKSKIALVKDSLEGEEESLAYCKLDFYFRLRAVLHDKLHACVPGGG